MPTYRYRAVDTEAADCPICSDGFETMQPLSDPALEACPSCEAPIRRVIGKAPVCVTNTRWTQKKLLSDGNLKKHGFKKLVKKSDGTYENVLR